MSSVALVPKSFECPEPSPRRAFLSVCAPAEVSVAGPLMLAPGLETEGPVERHVAVAGGVEAVAQDTSRVPVGPSVAELHAPTSVAPAVASDPDASIGLRSELVAMLPSLERRAYRWCHDTAEAQDLAQDTLLRALGNGSAFASEGHLRAWLYTVLRNLFISRRRRDQSWQRACGELSGLAQATPAAAPAPAFLTPSIERALARLPEAFARVICLVDLEDYTYADAASLLGVPVGTVMSRLFRARQRLAQDLPALI